MSLLWRPRPTCNFLPPAAPSIGTYLSRLHEMQSGVELLGPELTSRMLAPARAKKLMLMTGMARPKLVTSSSWVDLACASVLQSQQTSQFVLQVLLVLFCSFCYNPVL